MGDCCGCGNGIMSTGLGDGKSAGQGAMHYVCKAEYDRRVRDHLCGMCGIQGDSKYFTCDVCKNIHDTYALAKFYASL